MDLSKPIEIAEDVYWIGYVVPNDPFQCHTYLIKNKDESILIDPGSMITFPVVLEKIFSLVKLTDIKYIIMHHQDPDITGCYSTLESIMPKRKRYIVTHWRTTMLLKHFGWKTPFYLVNENNWQLKAGDRELEFIFTPYAHFPGAICTFDKATATIFSSDIFGSVNDDFKLFADQACLDGIKTFHKHYMPGKHILNYALKKIKAKEPKLIAPQHGSIIKDKKIMKEIFNLLTDLECGIFMLDDFIDDIFILSKVDDLLQELFEAIVNSMSFEHLLERIFSKTKKHLPIKQLALVGENYSYLIKDNKSTTFYREKISTDYNYKKELDKNIYIYINCKCYISKKDKTFMDILVKKISPYLLTSLEKDLYLKQLKQTKEILYLESITDHLTSLYNRRYLEEALDKKIKEARRYKFPLSAGMIDIDFFKKINDRFGHLIGDQVLKELAYLLKINFRDSDILARYGGEEFIVVMPFADLNKAYKRLEHFRKLVAQKKFCNQELHITISGGILEYKNEPIKDFLQKIDEKLYQAKKQGRNRIIF
ncbi:MAG: diguanylate cyclase [Desulfonauticus sp.]|nr:diguanylate cyclase [Desulfonauticus sp.]